MRTTPENITVLEKNEIFVFGSNLAGHHGAGAARLANREFGAVYYVGVGRTGSCYAIPTKDEKIMPMPIDAIRPYVKQFYKYASAHPELTFLVTKIGCGLAGNSIEDISPLFVPENGLHPNVILPAEFLT